jgi:hypothetical protein
MPPTFFALVIFQIGIGIFAHTSLHEGPSIYTLYNWDDRLVPSGSTYWSRWGLRIFLPGLDLNQYSDPHLLSSWSYRPALIFFFILFFFFFFWWYWDLN